MEIFNIGIGEMLVILIIMYVLLGPEGMLRAARWLGQTTRQAYRFFNETWRSITDVPMDLRDLPNALLKETGLKDTYDELRQEGRVVQTELNRGIGRVDLEAKADARALTEPKISPRTAAGANGTDVPEHLAADAVLAGAPALAEAGEPTSLAPANADGQDFQIRPVQQAVAADIRPAVSTAEVQSIGADSPRPKRGRPRKGEVRPPPEPKTPRKRGRPRKNRPEATAEGNSPTPAAPRRPAAEGRLPRKAPSQPGDPIVPIDLEAAQGARAYASNPAPSEDEENPDRNAA